MCIISIAFATQNIQPEFGPWAGWSISASANGNSNLYTVNAINGSWVVQNTIPTGITDGFGSQWIGIGGVSSTPLIQIGTVSDWVVTCTNITCSGHTLYAPFAETVGLGGVIPFIYTMLMSISPGDKMQSSINLVNGSYCLMGSPCWKLYLNDTNKSKNSRPWITYITFAPNRTSADWEEESLQPFTMSLPLSNFKVAYFGPHFTKIPNTNQANINYSTNVSIGGYNYLLRNIFSEGGAGFANASNLYSDNSSFIVYEGPQLQLNGNINASSTLLNFGQNSTLIGLNATGGSGNYTYTWIEQKYVNANTSVTTNVNCYKGPSDNQMHYIFSPGCGVTPGIYLFTLEVTDNRTEVTQKSNTVSITVNPNPSVSLPTNISLYIPIRITNSQNSPTSAPFDQAVTVDSAEFSRYENANLSNIRFFYKNGTIVPSWLEGSYKSSFSNASTRTLYWLKLQNGIGAGQTIYVYMGFGPTGSMMFNSNNTGADPYGFSSSYPIYSYDDGSKIFPFYDNFAGNTLDSNWTAINGSGKETRQGYYVDNGLYQNQSSGAEVSIYTGNMFHYGQIVDFGGSIPSRYALPSGPPYYCGVGEGTNKEGFFNAANAFSDNVLTNGQAILMGYGVQEQSSLGCSGGGYDGKWLYDSELASNNLFEAPSASSILFGSNNETGISSNATAYLGSYNLNYAFQTANVAIINSAEGELLGLQMVNLASGYLHWVRIRNSPPDGIMPNVTIASIPTNLSFSNPITLQGYPDTLTAHVPFNDPVTLTIGDPIASINGTGSVNYTICSTKSTCLPAGTYTVTVNDTKQSVVENWTLVIEAPPNVIATPSKSTLDQGQQIYLSANISNGTGQYDYQWYNLTLGNSTAITGQTGKLFLFNAMKTGTFKYYVIANDIGTNETYSAKSNNVTVTIYPMLSVNITPAFRAMSPGGNDNILMHSIVNGGTGNFTYQWYNFSSGIFPVPMPALTSNETSVVFNSLGDYSYLLIVTDEGTTTSPKASTISYPNNISVTYPIIKLFPKNDTIFNNQSITFTNLTLPNDTVYTFSYNISQYGKSASTSNYLVSGNSIRFFNINSQHPQIFNVSETAMDSSGHIGLSSNSTITVNPPYFWSPPNKITAYINLTIYNGQNYSIAANTQIPIYLNVVKYNAYAANNLVNFEVFNGFDEEIVPSWIENQTSNSIASNGNALIWVKLPYAIAAKSSSVNAISMGFANMSTSLLNHNNDGIAPELYCLEGGTVCPQTSYGEYDDGASVFNFYSNFSGSQLNDQWTNPYGSSLTVDNGLTLAPATSTGCSNNGGELQSANSFYLPGNTVDYYGILRGGSGAPWSSAGMGVFSSPNTCGGTSQGDIDWGASERYYRANPTSSDANINFLSEITVWSIGSNPSGYVLYYSQGYHNTQSQPTSSNLSNGNVVIYQQVNSGGSANATWVRIRKSLPNGIKPEVYFGPLLYAPLNNTKVHVTITLSPTSELTDAGQSVTFYNTTTGGTPPYVFAYSVSQFGTPASTGNYLISGNSIKFTNAGTYNVIENVTDSIGNIAHSSNSTITVNLKTSNSSVCDIVPADFNITACIPVSISNTQNSKMNMGTQIAIPFPANSYETYEAANMMNVFLYNASSGNTAPCWLEGNTLNEIQSQNLYASANLLYWCKMPDSIPAQSTDTNWYFGFANSSTDLYGNPIAQLGAAPQLHCGSPYNCPTSSYAGADNGNAVFSFYDNFSGTTLRSKWAGSTNPSYCTYTVSNGLEVTDSHSNGGNIFCQTYSLPSFTLPIISEGLLEGTTSSTYTSIGANMTATSQANTNSYLMWFNPYHGCEIMSSDGEILGDVSGISSTCNENVWSIYSLFASPNSITATLNYDLSASQNTSSVPVPSPTNIITSVGEYPGTAVSKYQWVRARVPPPNNVQPTISYSSLKVANSHVSLLFSSNPANAESSINVTATCVPNTDTCAVQSPLGTTLCSGTGSCVYQTSALPAGNYTYFANDLTLNHNVKEILQMVAYCGNTPSGFSVDTCVPIKIDNTQTSSILPNTQIAIPFPANSYETYEAANMMNIFLYNASSGKTAPCWLEGNTLNEMQSQNLYTSANLLYWCRIPDSIPAQSTDTNWYFGLAPSSTDLYGNSIAQLGAAPQLYCGSPYNCPASSYAGADNGNAVFNFYDNFSGTVLGSKWYARAGTATVNNSVTFTMGSQDSWLSSTIPINGLTNDTDFLGSIAGTTSGYDAQWVCYSEGSASTDGCTSYGFKIGGSSGAGSDLLSCSGSLCETYGTISSVATPTAISLFSIWSAGGMAYVSDNYGIISSVNNSQYLTSNIDFGGSSTFTSGMKYFLYYVRSRTQPPNNVQPSISYGTSGSLNGTKAAVAGSTAPYLGNAYTVSGQSTQLTATNSLSGGGMITSSTSTGGFTSISTVTTVAPSNNVGTVQKSHHKSSK